MPEGTKQFLDLEGLRFYDTKIKEVIADSQVKADWNEKDSSSLSYIKNKTHWVEQTLDQSSVVNFYLIKEAEDQTVLADRDDEEKRTVYAEMLDDDYGVFQTYQVGHPSLGKTNPQMENTVVSVTVAGITYTVTPNFIGTQPPYNPEDDPTRYYTVGNYNLFYSRCDTDSEATGTPVGPASITDASQANWPFCIWFTTAKYANSSAFIDLLGFEPGTTGYTITGDDEYTIPVTITNVNSTYHPLDARYIPVAQAIADGAAGYVTGDQVYDYVQANKGDINVIETVKVNGSALTPDANKAVDITVPSAPVQDVRVSTDGSAYTSVMSGTNADIDLSGYAAVSSLATVATSGSYEDLEDKPFGEESLVFSKTLRPAVFTGSDYSGISPVVVTDLVTDGTFVPFVEGDTYDVSYDGTLYENLAIQPRSIKYKGQEEEDPEVYLVLGNRDGLFLRSNIATMLSDETRALLEDSDIPFMMMHYDGSQDDRIAFAFFSNSYDHTLSVYEHGTDNLLYTVVLSDHELSLTNTPLLYCGTGTKALEDFHFEIGQTLRVKVNGQNCKGVWRVPEGEEETGAMEALIYPEGYVAPEPSEPSGNGDDLVVDNPYSGTELVLMLSADDSALGDMFAIGNLTDPMAEKSFEMNYTVVRKIDPEYIPTASSIASDVTGFTTGGQVYDYVQANKGDTNTIEVIKFKGNGDTSAPALIIDSSDKSVTVDVSSYALASQIPAVAAAIAAGDNGYTTGDQVYAAIAGLAGAMHFKGVIAGAESLPNAPEVGDVYIASAAFNFGQETVEAGDMFVYSNTGWKIVQGNISMAAIQQMITDATPAVITEDDLDVLLDIFTIEFAKWTHTDDQTGETETGHYSSADGGQGREDSQLQYNFLLKKTQGSQVSYILIRNWDEETPSDTSIHANYVTVAFDEESPESFTVTATGEAIPDVSVSPSLYGGLADTEGAFIVTIEGQTITASDISITTSK